jgi:hypothetical protein
MNFESGSAMRRREFTAQLGGLAALPLAWPFAARTHQLKTPVIGFLYGSSRQES